MIASTQKLSKAFMPLHQLRSSNIVNEAKRNGVGDSFSYLQPWIQGYYTRSLGILRAQRYYGLHFILTPFITLGQLILFSQRFITSDTFRLEDYGLQAASQALRVITHAIKGHYAHYVVYTTLLSKDHLWITSKLTFTSKNIQWSSLCFIGPVSALISCKDKLCHHSFHSCIYSNYACKSFTIPQLSRYQDNKSVTATQLAYSSALLAYAIQQDQYHSFRSALHQCRIHAVSLGR